MDAILARRCPICGQKIEINEPKELSRALQEHMKTSHPLNYARSRKLRKFLIPLLGATFIAPFIPIILIPQLGGVTEVLSFAGFLAPLAILVGLGRRTMKGAAPAHSAVDPGQLDASAGLHSQAGQSPVAYSGQEILGMVRDLGQRLEIRGFDPDSVSWQDYYVKTGFGRGSNRPVQIPYDGCRFQGKQIILAESSRNKLDTEEWAPLIASELIYQRKLREKRGLGLLVRIAPLTALYIIVPIILWQLGILALQGMTTVRGNPTPVVVAFFEVYSGTVMVFVMLLYIILGFRFDRQMRLKADLLASELSGKTVFLSALQKIGTAFPELMTKGRPSIVYPPGRPTITKRIEAVQGATSF